VRHVLRISEAELPDELVKALFRELDRDGSGDIDVDELIWFIENTRPDGSRKLPDDEAEASRFLADAAASRRPDEVLKGASQSIISTRSFQGSSLKQLARRSDDDCPVDTNQCPEWTPPSLSQHFQLSSSPTDVPTYLLNMYAYICWLVVANEHPDRLCDLEVQEAITPTPHASSIHS
jgi:hypothetical protein